MAIMEYSINLKLEILAPEDVLNEHNLTYYSVERSIKLNFLPVPGFCFQIKPNLGDDNEIKEKFNSLKRSVDNKPGIYEADKCIVKVDYASNYDLEVLLRPKMEKTYQGFQAMKEYVEYYGFKNRAST